MATQLRAVEGDGVADFSLPGWVYHDPEFFAVEMDRVIRPSWQIVCHVSDVATAGCYHTLDILGESVVVLRGDDRALRAFHNVCRHRAMRLVEGERGCARKLVCPYHAWTYALDGRLTGVPMRGDYPALDLATSGLVAIDLEIWHGFVFVRLEDDGGPSVATMMAPAEAEIAPYDMAAMAALGPLSTRPRRVNWKNVGDNYSDNLHIPVAHDGLARLFGKSYTISAHGWADRMAGELTDHASSNFWEAVYRRHLPHNPRLPATHQRRWLYWKLWPNIAFDFYADQIDFMQWLPTSPTTCTLRMRAYGHADYGRAMRVTRYANDRINRVVNAEDTRLIERVQAGMASRSYAMGPIGRSEVCLRNFAARLRDRIPEAARPTAPTAGWSHHTS